MEKDVTLYPQNCNLRNVAVSNVSQIVYSYRGLFFLRVDIFAQNFGDISKTGPFWNEIFTDYISFVVYIYIYTGLKQSNGCNNKAIQLSRDYGTIIISISTRHGIKYSVILVFREPVTGSNTI